MDFGGNNDQANARTTQPDGPALSNMAARRMDLRLTGFVQKSGWTYTRYADDVTFSASGEATQKTALILTTLRQIAKEEHFTVNEKKTRMQRQNRRQEVTGIVVNTRPNVPRATYRRLRAILQNAARPGWNRRIPTDTKISPPGSAA